MSRTVRTNLQSKLLSGQIAPRPGMHGHDRPEREPVDAGPMGSEAVVEQIAQRTHAGENFYAVFREVMDKLERGE